MIEASKVAIEFMWHRVLPVLAGAVWVAWAIKFLLK